MKTKLFCVIGLGLYIALSATDFALTFSLIERRGTGAFEANPLAAVWLENHGWFGLAIYKAGFVAIVLGAVGLMIPRRPGVAAGVVTFGCGVLLAVTAYTNQLLDQSTKSYVMIDAQGRPQQSLIEPLLALLDTD